MHYTSKAAKDLLADLQVGERLDRDEVEEQLGPADAKEFWGAFEAQGYVLSTAGQVGEVSICVKCDGEGMVDNKSCRTCDGFSTTVDFGRGLQAWRD